MLLMIISVTIAVLTYSVSANGLDSVGWGIFIAIVAFALSQVLSGLILRKRLMAVIGRMQKTLADGQGVLQGKINTMQSRPGVSQVLIEKMINKEQEHYIGDALEILKELEGYYKWHMLLKKQVATMRMQLYYQLHDFNKVDELLSSAMYADAITFSMRMAREHMQKKPELVEITFKKAIKKLKGAAAKLAYATYSWTLVKNNQHDAAIKVLVEGKEKTGNETLKKNWEFLVNGNAGKFSNKEFGEEWYSLQLEKPKVARQKQRVARNGRGNRPF